MADINLVITTANVTQKIGIKVYESSALNTEVASVEYTQPIGSQLNVTIPNLRALPHNIKVYETPGFPILGALLQDFWVDARENKILTARYYFTVDGGAANDPVDGSTTIAHPDFVGHVITGVFQRAFGYFKNTEYSFDSSTGVIDFSPFPLTLINADVFMVEITYPAAIAATTNNAPSIFNDYLLVSSNYTMLSSDLNKLVDLAAIGTALVLTLPSIAAIPDNAIIPIIANNGMQRQAIIRTQASQFIRFNRQDVTEIYIGENEEVWIAKRGSLFYLIKSSSSLQLVGTVGMVYKATNIANAIAADGSELSRAEYPRLWAFANTLGSNLISDTLWNTADANGVPINQMKFSSGDGTNTFRLPDLRGLHPRFLIGNRNFSSFDFERVGLMAGSYQADGIVDHFHKTDLNPNANSVAGSGKIGTGGDAPEGTFPLYKSSGPMANISGVDTPIGGLETRGQNVAFVAVIYI